MEILAMASAASMSHLLVNMGIRLIRIYGLGLPEAYPDALCWRAISIC